MSYPRTETCPGCGKNEVTIVGPGDIWVICWLCDLKLKDEDEDPFLSDVLRWEEEHMKEDAGADRRWG